MQTPNIPDDPSTLTALFQQMSADSKQRKTLKFRKEALNKLINGYELMKPQIDQALKQDLGYNSFISNFGAHSITLGELRDLLKGLDKWVLPQKVPNPLALGISSSYIEYQALGLVLVISAWNYPIYTAIPQVAAAIAAGNSVILKPSQLAPYTSKVLKQLFQEHMDSKYYCVVEGQVKVAIKLSQLPFDLICFTGSTVTGRLVAIQAAKNLTPCLLELGGKSPTVIDKGAKLDSAVMRVIFGKYLNCGQTCVGVDHVYVHQSIMDEFKVLLLQKIKESFGNLEYIQKSGDYGKIINKFHLDRLVTYLNQNHGGRVLYGGSVIPEKLFMEPTVVQQPSKKSLLMQQQIFGPILPLLEFDDLNEVISDIRSRPKPLVIYMFSEDNRNIQKLQYNTSSGSFVVNDAVVQLLNPHLPFGGVGASGYGRYHGKSGFINFSNPRSICKTKAINTYPLSTRFPPYDERKKRMMTFLLKIGGITYEQITSKLKLLGLIAIGGFVTTKLRSNL